MRAVLPRVRKTIERHALCPSGSRVLIGLSGGSDSVALLFLLRELSEHGGFDLAGVAHFNHQLRSAAGRDEAFCRELADRMHLRIVVESADVKGYARGRHLSVEDAARRIRYDFLERSADALGADRIAVGHTQDDQAETFLLKLMRRAGLTGLGGIYPRRGRVIRPLLDASRAELRAHLSERGERWMEDETNADLDNPRNRIRHVVLPELDDTAGGPTRPAIARAAGLMRDDGQWLDELADERYGGLATVGPDGVTLEASATAAETLAIRRRGPVRGLPAGAGDRQNGLQDLQAGNA